jgi:hypothetical protein
MRHKALPLSVKATPRPRPTGSMSRSRGPRPRRLRDWLATIPIALLLPALVIVGQPAEASTPILRAPNTAFAGEAILVSGQGFPKNSNFQFLWNASPEQLPTARSNVAGEFAVSVVVPATTGLGLHTLDVMETRNGNPAKSQKPGSDTPVPVLASTVIEVVAAIAPALTPVTATATPGSAGTPAPTAPTATVLPTPTATVQPTPTTTVQPTPTTTVAPISVPAASSGPTPTPVPITSPTPVPISHTPVPSAAPVAAAGSHVWLSTTALLALPMHGAAWDRVAATRFVGANANVSDQDSNHDIATMGAALYAVRTGDQATRDRVIAALTAAIGTEAGGRWLAVGRNLGAYVIAADLIGIRSGPIHNWLAQFMTRTLAHNNSGAQITFRQSAWSSGSNASAQEGFAYTALAAYLGDRSALDWSWTAYRRYVGDRSSPHRISSNSDAWQLSPSDPVGIQNAGATKNGCSIGGAISNDMSRGGDDLCAPAFTQYPWVGLEGAVPAALVFERAGYPAFAAESSALKRAAEYLYLLRTQTGNVDWYDATRSREVKRLLNWRYGLGYPAAAGTGGRTFGFTEWTH